MVAENKDFTDFKRYFLEYVERFGLNGYKIYFMYEPLKKSFAEINTKQNDRVATVYLNSKLTGSDKLHKDIKGTAKHEALHLLIFSLEDKAWGRFTTKDSVYEAAEELTRKLEALIDD